MNLYLTIKYKTRLNNFFPNTSVKTIFMNMKDSKTNEPHKFVFNLSQSFDLRSSNRHISLQALFIYYTWKIIRQQYSFVLNCKGGVQIANFGKIIS